MVGYPVLRPQGSRWQDVQAAPQLQGAHIWGVGLIKPIVYSFTLGWGFSSVREAIYLGGMLNCDGRVASELSRRIGEATGILDKLKKLWSHSSIGLARKLKIYDACVLSKLLYSLD